MEKAPLAWRFSPEDLKGFIGQKHILSPGKPLRVMIEKDMVRSVVFYGPPGTGKTCLAHIIASKTQALFVEMSAVTSGKRQLLEVLERARERWEKRERTLLFVDEIHRFNKVQQETLLPAVEKGQIILIGASTENPYFALVPGLRSRTHVYPFYPFSEGELLLIMERALERDEALRSLRVEVERGALEVLAHFSSGDARKALNALELACTMVASFSPPVVTPAIVQEVFQKSYPYDTQFHYDAISAFIKSMRGSDPDATLFWLAFMIEAGEDPLYIARRIVIAASEDVGLADPAALVIAVAAYEGVKEVGLPEGAILLSQAALYVATSPKSNKAYLAICKAREEVKKRGVIEVPPHLRDASSYVRGKGYVYPHEYPQGFIDQEYMPPPLTVFYKPGTQGREAKIGERLKSLWKDRYG